MVRKRTELLQSACFGALAMHGHAFGGPLAAADRRWGLCRLVCFLVIRCHGHVRDLQRQR